MASAVLAGIGSFWHFLLRKPPDDLRRSNELVGRLSIPEQTKQFVFAIRDPSSPAVIYILAAQNLSEQSAVDAECLIREVQPDAVVAQVAPFALSEIQETNKSKYDELDRVPTSAFGVLKGCFVNKISKEKYENLAGIQVLQAIFGVRTFGHLFTARKVSKEFNAQFFLLESPFGNVPGDQKNESQTETIVSSLLLQPRNLAPTNASPLSSASKRFILREDNYQSLLLKPLASEMASAMPKPSPQDTDAGPYSGLEHCEPNHYYQVPSFAQSIYPLLTDLHEMFSDLPAIGKALRYAQKILIDVHKGDPVDAALLSQVHPFRMAVEGLRIALNNNARNPQNDARSTKSEFSELPSKEKGHVLLAQALKSQTKDFQSVVAIVDASCLAGIRRHWNTPLPPEFGNLADCFIREDDGEMEAHDTDKKRSLSKKPVVTVGAGATAILGASSLSKAIPASTFLKVITYKVPASLKIGLAHTQRNLAIVLCKLFSPTKILAPGLATSGTKASALKMTASAEKIRAVAHGVIASAEKTSFQAVRSTFYEIMRHRGRAVGARPWAVFGCSVASCAGLLVYGDGIEWAAESAPSAPAIACLGRGLQSLQEACNVARVKDGEKIQESIKSLMYKVKKMKLQ